MGVGRGRMEVPSVLDWVHFRRVAWRLTVATCDGMEKVKYTEVLKSILDRSGGGGMFVCLICLTVCVCVLFVCVWEVCVSGNMRCVCVSVSIVCVCMGDVCV